MSVGRKPDPQEELFVPHQQLRGLGHPFYEALDRSLLQHGFDDFAQRLCEPFYSHTGRPGLAPGVYFRCLLVGYFEGIGSERGIAWRIADSLSLRRFIGITMSDNPPDHSTISRTRRRLDVEVHEQVFAWVLERLAEAKLIKGRTVGIDGSTLEANAAMRSIVRRKDGRSYDQFLDELAKASGIETPTAEDRQRVDRKREGKKTSNKDWVNPHDPEAEITKMKDGRTHLAYKQEHAVDLEGPGAIVGVTIHPGATGDTTSIHETLAEAEDNLSQLRTEGSEAARKQVAPKINDAVTDKGYNSDDVLCGLEEAEVRSYIPEPKRQRRKWKGKEAQKKATRRNRKRTKGKRGKALQRKRAEYNERSFAHTLDSGGLRRPHLRGVENIKKRALLHTAGFNLGLLMREMIGISKPRALQGRAGLFFAWFWALVGLVGSVWALWWRDNRAAESRRRRAWAAPADVPVPVASAV